MSGTALRPAGATRGWVSAVQSPPSHAPIIFPAVLGLPLEYRPAFYLHVGVLHISLILRVVGDLVDSLGRWRVWGGLLNAAALLLFMFNTGRSMALRGNHGDPI